MLILFSILIISKTGNQLQTKVAYSQSFRQRLSFEMS